MRKQFGTVLVILFLFSSTAFAEEIPKMFNMDLREAGSSHIQLSPYGGVFIGDTISTSYITGLQAAYRWSHHFATAIDFGYSPMQVDAASAYGSTVTDPHFYNVSGSLMAILPAAVKVGHHKILEMDLYGQVGGGWLRINKSNLPNGLLGLGALLYLKPPWFALRMEARSYIYKLPIARGGLSVDGTFLIGPTFLFDPAVF
ncbi:MAG: hypothetical protein Q7T03_04910 [Deltaproteobacteria bacterium]|nr:hypothetical protein [Deltaproteobacteria bacterium]